MIHVKENVVSLGRCMARLREVSPFDVSLTIVSPSYSEEGMYEPAESVNVFGRDNLNTLLKLLQDALGEP